MRRPARSDAVTELFHSTPSPRASGTLGAHRHDFLLGHDLLRVLPELGRREGPLKFLEVLLHGSGGDYYGEITSNLLGLRLWLVRSGGERCSRGLACAGGERCGLARAGGQLFGSRGLHGV